MNNSIYVGLSRQMTLRNELDVVANNIANSDTAGFKVESLMVQSDPQTPPTTGAGPIGFVYDVEVARDFSQGSLRQTGAPLDLGIQGDGFFQVKTASGTAYTRDGRFAMDAQGQIVTASGDPVLSNGGSPIQLDPTKGEPRIARDGTVSQAGATVGKIGLMRFADRSSLQKSGGGYFTNVSNLQPQPAADAKMEQGMVENSNVNPVNQITRLIEVSRAYEQVSQMVDQTGSVSDQAVQRLGKVN